MDIHGGYMDMAWTHGHPFDFLMNDSAWILHGHFNPGSIVLIV